MAKLLEAAHIPQNIIKRIEELERAVDEIKRLLTITKNLRVTAAGDLEWKNPSGTWVKLNP